MLILVIDFHCNRFGKKLTDGFLQSIPEMPYSEWLFAETSELINITVLFDPSCFQKSQQCLDVASCFREYGPIAFQLGK